MLPEEIDKIAVSISDRMLKKPIDWDEIEQIIEENQSLINRVWQDEEECDTILSEVFMGFYEDGSDLIPLTELFLRHGFDPSANEGETGATAQKRPTP